MALAQKLLLRQTQSLVMTPQLMQAIKLLQLSHLDLAAYVDGELERNPLLERTAEQDQGRDEPGEAPAEPPPPEAAEPAGADWMDDRLESQQSMEARLDTDLNNVFPDDSAGPARSPEAQPGVYSEWAGTGAGGHADGDYNLEAFVTAETTLADHRIDAVFVVEDVADPAERVFSRGHCAGGHST